MNQWLVKILGVATHRWRGSTHLTETLISGDIKDLKCKALQIEILEIDLEYESVKLRIKIIDQLFKDVTYVDYNTNLCAGESVTVLDLNHALEIKIS